MTAGSQLDMAHGRWTACGARRVGEGANIRPAQVGVHDVGKSHTVQGLACAGLGNTKWKTAGLADHTSPPGKASSILWSGRWCATQGTNTLPCAHLCARATRPSPSACQKSRGSQSGGLLMFTRPTGRLPSSWSSAGTKSGSYSPHKLSAKSSVTRDAGSASATRRQRWHTRSAAPLHGAVGMSAA